MDRVDRLIENLMRREGGYVDHPADRGGPTNHGVTQATLSAWRGRPVSKAEVQALAPAEAAAIYRANYFLKPGFDRIPDPELQELVFDMAANHGARWALMQLQAVVGAGADGTFGPETAERLAAAGDLEDERLRLLALRLRFYVDRVRSTPDQIVFLDGWTDHRVAAFAPAEVAELIRTAGDALDLDRLSSAADQLAALGAAASTARSPASDVATAGAALVERLRRERRNPTAVEQATLDAAIAQLRAALHAE